MLREFAAAASQKISDFLSQGKSVWVVVSRAEGDDSNYPVGKRITPEILADVASRYDPSFRRAPVVQAVEGIQGRAHEKGELNPPVGWIEELSFDGLNLWARIRDVAGRFARHIENGMVRGSVFIIPGQNEDQGHYQLRHFALIASQMAGTPGIPHADEMFAVAREASLSLGESGDLIRSIGFDEEEEMVDKNELKDELVRSLESTLPDVLSRTLEPIREQILAGVDEKITAIRADLESVSSRLAQSEKDSVASLVRSRVEGLSKDGKIRPAEVETEVALLLRASAEEREQRFTLIAARDAMSFEETPEGREGGSAPKPGELERLERTLVNPGATYNKDELLLVRDLMAEAGGDSQKYRELVYERFGQSN